MTFCVRLRRPATLAAGLALVLSSLTVHATAQQQPPPAGAGQSPATGAPQTPAPERGRAGRGAPDPAAQARGRRGGPPQPQQKQGIEYFVGDWTFTGTGRESPLSIGPRQGTTTFARNPKLPNALDIRTIGKSDDTGAAYKESGTAEWDEAKKTMSFKETLGSGTQVTGTGDWSSPLSIRYQSQPVKASGQTVLLRRTYSILAAHSFSLAEEISIDGAPYTRLGNAVFTKVGAK